MWSAGLDLFMQPFDFPSHMQYIRNVYREPNSKPLHTHKEQRVCVNTYAYLCIYVDRYVLMHWKCELYDSIFKYMQRNVSKTAKQERFLQIIVVYCFR
jgi:hypothetical protein